jgi:hypothetical protein
MSSHVAVEGFSNLKWNECITIKKNKNCTFNKHPTILNSKLKEIWVHCCYVNFIYISLDIALSHAHLPDIPSFYIVVWSSFSVTCDRSLVSSTNKTDRHDITEILLKVALNTPCWCWRIFKSEMKWMHHYKKE